jgi:amidohydrolase
MKNAILASVAALAILAGGPALAASAPSYDAAVFAAAAKVEPKVVAWRRDIHEHPELGFQEVRTSKLVADHLRSLGYEVRLVGGTGVVGVLKGGRPGKVVALRADMDALPVAEPAGLAFASKATGTWDGKTVPIMHACGHDAHTAMLMGAAEVLAGMKAKIPGTVVVLFQPAEEGGPGGTDGGAVKVLKDNALASPKPDAIFGIHVVPGEVGALTWRPGPFMAGADAWIIDVKGKQTHGAAPWAGIDAASVAVDLVTAINQITAHQVNVAHAPTVMTVGEIKLGSRNNIIPNDFQLTGTLRTFDPEIRKQVIAKLDGAVQSLEPKYGAHGTVSWGYTMPVTANDRGLTARMKPTLVRAAKGKAKDDVDYAMASEDFSDYQAVAPTVFYHLGIGDTAPNHSPLFKLDETALEVGVRAHVLMALDFLSNASGS